MHPADRECVERVQAGDRGALAELYDRYGALLHPLALRITGNTSDADEVLYETWLQVCGRSVPFDTRRGVVAVWLLSIVRNNALERRRAMATQESAELPAAQAGPIEVVPERVDLADRAIEALGLFDVHERQVLELAYYEGQTQSETASRMGVSADEVRTLTRQALDRLHATPPQEEAA